MASPASWFFVLFTAKLNLEPESPVSFMLQRRERQEPSEEGFLDFLVESRALDTISQKRVIAAMHGSGQPVDKILLELGLLEETKLADAFSDYLGYERISAIQLSTHDNFGLELPLSFLRRSSILLISADDHIVTIATARPLDEVPCRALAYYLNRKPIIKIITASELAKHLSALSSEEEGARDNSQISDVASGDVERLRDIASEAPIIRLLNRLIANAVECDASDIHIELLEDHVRVRCRVDGALQVVDTLDRSLQLGLVSRVKILAKLNIAEQRLPQDQRP
jgi:general secretion pathway protein E